MSIARSALLWASQNKWLGDQALKRGFTRRAVKRFMPGEDLASAIAAAKEIAPLNIGTVLTQLGENITTAEQVNGVLKHYEGVIDEIAKAKLKSEPSIKLTQLGLDVDAAQCLANVKTLAKRAQASGILLWIDIEYSHYVDRTLDVYTKVKREFPNVGLALQAYLYRTEKDLEDLLAVKPTIRLVKGAYAEPANIAFPKKSDVDANFLKLGTRLLTAFKEGKANPPIFGTHDVKLHRQLQATAQGMGLDKKAFEIHMLYGIQRDAQIELAKGGYLVKVLVSYGSAWFPWYMRRLAERPANVWFVVKSLF